MAKATATQQFVAVLRKNIILLTRSRKTIFGLGGWAALLIQILTPAAFFLLMCVPRYYLKPLHYPLYQSATTDIDDKIWSGRRPYQGDALPPSLVHLGNTPAHEPCVTGPAFERGGRAHLLLAPNSSAVNQIATLLAKAVACPKDPRKRNMGLRNFYGFFRVNANTTACNVGAPRPTLPRLANVLSDLPLAR
jgi:hypothetical protein